MWVKKSSKEINKSFRKDAHKNALFWAVVLMSATAFLIKTGYNKWRSSSFDPIPWDSFFKTTPIILTIGILVYIVGFMLYKRKPVNSLRICIKCEQTYNSPTAKCTCGGQLYFIKELKWVEDNSNINASP